MEVGFIALVVVMTAVGVLIGISIERRRISRKPTQGYLDVDYSDPEDGPYLFLNLKVPVDEVVRSERVTFDVRMTQYLSQE